MEIGNGSWKITDRVQYKAGSDFFPFHCEIGKEVHKAFEDAERGVVRFSRNNGYILWCDCSLECLVVSEFISSCTIGKADGRILSSSHFVANVTEIRACRDKVYLAYLSKIVLQMQGNTSLMERICLILLGRCSFLFCPMQASRWKGKGARVVALPSARCAIAS